MAFEYKCVAGPTIVAVKSAKARDQAVKAFEDIMNIEAAEGWEYVGIDEFHISEPEGWLSRKRVYVPSKILVFRREKKGSAMAEALALQKRDLKNDSAPKLIAATATAETASVEAVAPAIVQDTTSNARIKVKAR